jgi:hypothetical protein
MLQETGNPVESFLASSRDFDQFLTILRASASQSAGAYRRSSQTSYIGSLMLRNSSKCFFLTANGYFGTAPDPPCVGVTAGDRVAPIPGLDHPVLLRAAPGGWKLLTHVYLHGIMHGEAWTGDSALEKLPLV